jgi:predicted TIM-barrel fold metal-dependent hydrolase
MNAPVLEKNLQQQQRLSIVDCDIHPIHKSPTALLPYLPKRWQEHSKQFGQHVRQGMAGQLTHPRMMAAGQRVDAYPADGSPPGSDLDLMRKQHLDPNGVQTGMLVALARGGMEEQNQEYAAALSRAVNDWQIEEWVKPEPRLKAGVVVPQDDPATCVAEIERCAANSAFRQIIVSPRTAEPLGRRRYWPIFEAAQAAGLPIGLHPAAYSGGYPSTGSGWPVYYMQEHYSFETGMQGVLASLLFEGVFERFPKLRICLIESGFTWVPAVGWRMDKHWERMRAEVPHVKRPPSEYLREHFWFATQPIEEPENPAHLSEMIDWIGWDRVVFSSDYPHWDFDDPRYTFKINLTERQRAMIFRENAQALYRLQ